MTGVCRHRLLIVLHVCITAVQGYNANLANVELVVAALRDGLQQQGFKK